MSQQVPKALYDCAKKVQPLFNRVLIKRYEAPKSTKSGIVLPEDPKERIVKGTVMAVGPGSRNADGSVTPISVQVGDDVILPDFGGCKVEVDGKLFHMFRENDLLAKLQDQ